MQTCNRRKKLFRNLTKIQTATKPPAVLCNAQIPERPSRSHFLGRCIRQFQYKRLNLERCARYPPFLLRHRTQSAYQLPCLSCFCLFSGNLTRSSKLSVILINSTLFSFHLHTNFLQLFYSSPLTAKSSSSCSSFSSTRPKVSAYCRRWTSASA